MVDARKPKPASDADFRGMMWWYKFKDLFHNPRERIEKLPLKEGMTVVDYGCGPGRYTLPTAKLVGQRGKVFALDIHPLAISIVDKEAIKQGLKNIKATLLDSYDTGIQETSVDIVLLLDTIHHVSDRDALLKEIHRILKPDGLLFMDPGHMKMSKAQEIIEGSNLFTIEERRGNDMIVAPKAEQ